MRAQRRVSFIIYDNADNRAKAGNAGAIEAAVAAMRRHSVSVGLQHAARVALSLMANGNTDNGAKVGNAGAVEAAVAAMRTHRNNVELQ